MANKELLSRNFLTNEFWQLSWSASVQRAGVYRPGLASKDRLGFRGRLVEWLDIEVIPNYRDPVSEETHLCHLGRTVKYATQIGSDVLADGRYRIGVAQKLVNLQLKYLWCGGLLPEPPHCPVDRVILTQTRYGHSPPAWTRMDTEEAYLDAIGTIREKAEVAGATIAAWELAAYADATRSR